MQPKSISFLKATSKKKWKNAPLSAAGSMATILLCSRVQGTDVDTNDVPPPTGMSNIFNSNQGNFQMPLLKSSNWTRQDYNCPHFCVCALKVVTNSSLRKEPYEVCLLSSLLLHSPLVIERVDQHRLGSWCRSVCFPASLSLVRGLLRGSN